MPTKIQNTAADTGVGARLSLEAETRTAIVAVRTALAELVAAIPGDIQRPADLQRIMGVDSKICWQVFNVIRTDSVMSAAKHVPTSAALKRPMASARRLGVSAQVIAAVENSVSAFEEVIGNHADSRQEFDAMVSALAAQDSDDEQIATHQRRAVYRGLSHIWGAQVDVFSLTTLVRKSASGRNAEKGPCTDQVIVSGKRGLRRLRPGAYVGVYGCRLAVSQPDSPLQSIALDRATEAKYGAPLLPEFSTNPMPQFRSFTDSEGWMSCELVGEEIGRGSSVDLTFGSLASDVPMPHDSDGRMWFGSNALLSTPAGVLVCNLLIHRPSLGLVEPEVLTFANVPGGDEPSAMRRLSLPMGESVVRLGRGDQVTPTPDAPDYPRLLQRVSSAVGWNLAEFDAYRVRVAYPVMHSVVRLFFFAEQ